MPLPPVRADDEESGPRRHVMIGLIVVLLFVVSVVAVAVYVVVRPFTHIHYQHPSERLWRPLD
jgi:hypothetical protein